jgi:hypothetical protein
VNRFIIENTPVDCAKSHCDKHVPKMVVEEAQMLSTAHRLLDGVQEYRPSKSGKRMVKYWKLPDDRQDVLYSAVHMNHPCTKWSMETLGNYSWSVKLFLALCNEYTYRYNKVHKSYELAPWLIIPPTNINQSLELTPMPLAMGAAPECKDPNDVVGSYRKFYQTKQDRFRMAWTNRPVPEWFEIRAA